MWRCTDVHADHTRQQAMSALAPPIRLVGVSGSLRAQSYNSAALRAVTSLLPEGMSFAIANLIELPFYNSDVEQQGLPAAAQRFRREIAAADALIFAVPEYNFSIAGVLKNALEWLSRPPDPRCWHLIVRREVGSPTTLKYSLSNAAVGFRCRIRQGAGVLARP
jgi:NAD(P)H-dependent FMN reductase